MEKNKVLVTITGQKYHSSNCLYLPKDLNKKTFSMTENKAKREGYMPCSLCIKKEL